MSPTNAIDEVRNFAKAHGYSRWQLAKKAGLGVQTLRSMWEDDWSPNWSTIQRLQVFMEAHQNASDESENADS